MGNEGRERSVAPREGHEVAPPRIGLEGSELHRMPPGGEGREGHPEYERGLGATEERAEGPIDPALLLATGEGTEEALREEPRHDRAPDEGDEGGRRLRREARLPIL